MKLVKKAGSTSEIWQIFIQDSSSTTGAGLTALAFNSGSLTAYYHRDTDTTATAISLADMTVGSFTSSGFKKIDDTNMPGCYQFCPPDAALAAGAKSCIFILKGAANMAQLPIEVQLTAVNPDSATAFITGVNSLAPPSNWNLESIDANGRLDIIKVAGTTQSAGDIIGDTNDIQSRLPAALTGAGNIKADIQVNSDKTGYTLSTAGVQAIWDALTSALTTVGSIGKLLVDNINATISSRLASASYTAPDNTSIAAIKVVTDKFVFTIANKVDSSIQAAGDFAQGAADKVWSTASRTLTAFGFTPTISAASVTAIWDALTSSMTTAGSIGKKLADWVLGSDNKNLLSTDAQSGVTIPTVTTVTLLTQANTELTAPPASTASIINMIKWKFLLSKNKIDQTSTTQTPYADDSATPVGTATVSDNGTTAVRGKFS